MAVRRASVAAAGSSGLVGLSIVLTKPLEVVIDPVTLALLRYAVGAALLLPFVLRDAGRPHNRGNLVPVALLGILQFALLTVLLNSALEYTSAGGVALLFSLFPCLTLVLGYALGRERLTPWKTLGVALCSVAAVIEMINSNGLSGGFHAQWTGDLLALGSALCGAVCAVLYRPYLENSSVLSFGGFAMLSAVAVLSPASFVLHPWSGLRLLSVQSGVFLLLLGSFSAVGYGLWLWAFRHNSPTRVTVFIGLSPIIAGLAGVVFLNEPLSWVAAVAVTVLVLGLWVTQWDAFPGLRALR